MNPVGRDPLAGVAIAPAEAWQAPQLEALQVRCFPTLGAQELMRAEHFLHHLAVFPEADLVAVARTAPDGRPLLEPQVVGLGSGFFVDFDFAHPGHTFRELIDDGWYGRHDPGGAWYYGADVSVDPAWRGLGLGRRLYDARKALVRKHGKRGIVAGGVLPGYAHHKHAMSAAAYVAKVVAGELTDPTLTMQLRNGFVVEGVLQGYLEDAAADDWAALIVWRDPDFRSDGAAVRAP
ncbi:MAG: GNAT family N-acetyltransferase [Trueperaceae bacterium]|nr:GNAT family N-acetyltransferase [Trueperaceae bacterium]